jgi:type IV pilus assembly protein PilA
MSKPVKIILIICGVLAVGSIPFLLIVMTLAVPVMQRVNIRAHETSAMQSLHVLNSAEGEYSAAYPERGFACTLPTLGGSPQSSAPSPEAAQIIGDDLVSGNKAGYTFAITCTNKTRVKNQDKYSGYRIVAVPNSVGHSGNRGFCTDESGEIRFDPKGGFNCTELLQ